MPVILSYASPMIKPRDRVKTMPSHARNNTHPILHNRQTPRSSGSPIERMGTWDRICGLTMFRRPTGLHKNAPIATPGNAMDERSSCHSAVFLMSRLCMTLEIMVAENTLLGKITKSCRNLNKRQHANASCDNSETDHAPQVPINDFQ